jgi:predicted RND superfamily exporter protein
MAAFWRSAGRLLNRRTAATVSVVILVTIALGVGLQRLDFSTGQNSYIDPASQVAKDNERYQKLFGGENMVVLFTVDEGKSVVDLFTPAYIAQFTEIVKQLLTSEAVQSVVSPLTLLPWTQDLITRVWQVGSSRARSNASRMLMLRRYVSKTPSSPRCDSALRASRTWAIRLG